VLESEHPKREVTGPVRTSLKSQYHWLSKRCQELNSDVAVRDAVSLPYEKLVS